MIILRRKKNIFIPPVYEVYRGYIVFAFSVCVFVNFFFPSQISQELLDLGFWNLVQTSGMTGYTVYKRISHIWLISPFIGPFFFLSNNFFHLISSASVGVTVFKFCMHNEDNQVHYCKQNQGAEIYFCLLFLFFPFSISHSKVINMEIFVKDFSGTAWPRILKFGTNIRYDRLYCV